MQARHSRILLHVALWITATAAAAQAQQTHKVGVDLAVTYQTVHADHVYGANSFFAQGGAAELQVGLYRGLGITASVTGENAGASATGGAPLSFVATLFGPHYKFAMKKRTSVFIEAMGGEINGFNSVFPGGSGPIAIASNGAQSSASSIAVLTGGGVDITLRHRFALRAIQADWLHTQLPNGTTNAQNSLRLGAGIVYRFRPAAH